MQRTSRPFSVTCVTHDEAVLHCLNALAHFAERAGVSNGESAMDPSGSVWPSTWTRAEGTITFHFSDPRRRGLFLGEATRLLSGKWTRVAMEDDAQA